MIIDGRKIAEEIGEVLREKAASRPGRAPSVGLVYAGENSAIDQFIRIKSRFGNQIGVKVQVYKSSPDISAEKLSRQILTAAAAHDGVVIQLPLPRGIDARAILNLVPLAKDIDVLSEQSLRDFERGRSQTRPPVAGACEEILSRAGVDLAGKKVTVIGRGRLVGVPVLAWLRRRGVEPAVVGREDENLPEILRESDIIISGAGAPGLIKPDMIKIGAAVLDAGTSEAFGKIAGDADPACAERAGVFTPVPGGLGPVTVAVLFQNLFLNL